MRALLVALALLLVAGSAHAQSTPPSSSIDRPLASRVERAVHIAGEPDWLATGGGWLWVTAPASTAVLRLDRSTGEITARVPVEHACGPIARARGAIWVHTCGLPRAILAIDPDRAAVTDTVHVGMADSEGAFAFAYGALWVVTDSTGTLARVDLPGRRVTSTTKVAPNSFTIVTGADALWVVSTNGGSPGAAGLVQRVEPRTGRVVATIVVGPGARFAAFGEGALWTLNRGDSSVSRVDVLRNRETARIPLGDGASYGDIAVGARRVWVRTSEILLAEIDPKTNRVVARYREPEGARRGSYGSGAVRVAGRSVWLSAHDVDSLWRIRTGSR